MKQTRDCLLTFRVTRSQMGQFTRLAAFEGVTLSRLIRALLSKELERVILDGFEVGEEPAIIDQKPIIAATFNVGIGSPIALHGMKDMMSE